MVAAYVGKLLAVTDEDIIAALQTVTLTGNRTEWKKAANGADILSDVYNANPTAMRLILETFANIAKNPEEKDCSASRYERTWEGFSDTSFSVN